MYAAIGAALYAVVTWAFNVWQIPGAGQCGHSPGSGHSDVLRHRFWSDCGTYHGFVGNILADLLSGYGFWIWWDLGNGIMGLIPGLFSVLITDFKGGRSVLLAEISVVLGVLLGMGVAAISEMWVSGADMNTVIFANFLPAFITNVLWGLVLLPLLMVAYSAIVTQSGR